jgi:NAD(P)-dependent dehydrogenase (short-subunit alcohol dehydrogenase family)
MTPKRKVDRIPDQEGRLAIVTGANSGIGYETAKALATAGAAVILACRSDEKGQEAAGRIIAEHPQARVSVKTLDLSSLASVRAFAAETVREHHRLDLLINNAGVMMPPERTLTDDGFELQFGINHLGHFALTALLLDLMIGTDGSRVVTVSSSAHRWGEIDFDDLQWERRRYQRMASYGQSKLANLLFTFELQRRLEQVGAATVALAAHPGWTGTNLQRHSGAIRRLNPMFAMKPWQGALPTLYAATAPDAQGGEYYGPDGLMELRGYPTRVATSDAALDVEVAERLWRVSEELTGVPCTVRRLGG